MRWLINYIRSCFCKHEWECLMDKCAVWSKDAKYPVRYEWLYVCKKCKTAKKIKG